MANFEIYLFVCKFTNIIAILKLAIGFEILMIWITHFLVLSHCSHSAHLCAYSNAVIHRL